VKVPVFEGGRRVDELCEAQAKARGLTVLDLSETWSPRVFGGDERYGSVPYRERWLALAGEHHGDDASWERERRDRWLELYGVWPTFARMRERLADEERHACHAALPGRGLAALDEPIDTWRPIAKQRADRLEARRLQRELEGVAATRGVGLDVVLADPDHDGPARAFRRLRGREEAIRDLQERLRCDRLLDPAAEAGILDARTISAMEAWFRRHMIVSWRVDLEVRDALLTDTRELDLRQALRALRARVVDATGLVEDGSAAGARGLVAGRGLDTSVFARVPGAEPLPDAAPDLASRAADEAARALGWTSVGEILHRMEAGLPPRVAVRLSPPPEYHTPHMDLAVVIDRGDVSYDPPRPRTAGEDAQKELPTLTLVARHAGGTTPLLRYPTTIGGWHPETVRGTRRVMLSYKESPTGRFLWRDVVAAPSWIPPASTPARDLVRPASRGGWAPKTDTFGPHYASAFGLVMMIHHARDAATGALLDGGIRTHGSASYGSIFEGTSHGCHRLHNHRALELAGFLLAHRQHHVRGPIQLDHTRSFTFRGCPFRLDFPSRGFRYELDPPIEVEVREGRLVGDRRTPPAPVPLPRHLATRYAFD
jgi:hypothetical protein